MNAQPANYQASTSVTNYPKTDFSESQLHQAWQYLNSFRYQELYEFCILFARQGNQCARYFVGLAYAQAWDKQQSLDWCEESNAIKWLHEAQAEHPEATYQLGMYSLKIEQYGHALRYLKKLSASGNNSGLSFQKLAEVNHSLGAIYFNGSAGERNVAEAYSYYKQSAIYGNTNPDTEVYIKYIEYFEFDPPRIKEGISYLEQAHKGGNVTATFYLACSHAKNGCYAHAVMFYQAAQRMGHPKAESELQRLLQLELARHTMLASKNDAPDGWPSSKTKTSFHNRNKN